MTWRRSPAAAQALEMLQAIAAQAEPVSAAQLARTLGIARSTTYNLLNVLIEYGYVIHHDERRRYGLGLAAHELGSAYQRQASLRRLAQPLVNALVDGVGENAHFAVLQGTDVVYLIEGRALGRPLLISDVGVRLPAHLTATGLALLAQLSIPQVRALYPTRDGLFTRHGIGPTTPTELRRELVAVRRDGYAVERSAVMPDLASVAAAAVDATGHPVGAFTLTFASAGLSELPRFAAEVTAAARRLSARIRR